MSDVVVTPPETVPIAVLKPADSPRAQRHDDGHVRELAECPNDFDPILVHRPTMRVIDGMHRLAAALLRGRQEIRVRYFEGSEADAYVLSVQLNVRHGLPLSRAERRLAAVRILASHPHWSDRAIAGRTGLSDKTVGRLRRCSSAEIPHVDRRVGRDGSVRPLSSAEGRLLVASLLAADPGTSLRELARRSELSLATVRDVRERLNRGQDPVPKRQREVVLPVAAVPRIPRRPSKPDTRRAPGAPALRNLARDPALKASESGRLLLRALFTTEFTPAQWQRIVEALPEHWAPVVRALAARRAAEWNALADALAGHSQSAA
ncbi:chromosome partitioning protein ParB [Streptomyces cahuitamycinicus]|uniref:Chromosome partitioning protein ParB n=2 Tax=Streptomyces cahuitamycinicus TaxID=2070367 RepID=A0A2N8TXF8_9ACTN|nr:chromosome partitioning protein ParB [Streptomyces cahuitamycinicus]